MKYLSETLNNGKTKIGSDTELALYLGITKSNLSDIKAGRRGLPVEACYKLVDLTDADLARVIAESESITAKKPEEVEFWKKKLEALAASIFLFVILNMSPTPAEAAPALKADGGLCILCKIIKELKQRLLQALQMSIPKYRRGFLAFRVHHMTA